MPERLPTYDTKAPRHLEIKLYLNGTWDLKQGRTLGWDDL